MKAKIKFGPHERNAGPVARLVLMLFVVLGCANYEARADTISYADAVSLLAEKCGSDIERHCRGVSLANNQIQSCLQQNAAKVSAACGSTLQEVQVSIRTRQAAQLSVFKVCRGDAARHCQGVKGEANVLGCLLITKRIDDAQCNQAITDAGWR